MSRYYDYVLALIPLTLLGGTAALVVGGFALTVAVSAAASVSVAVIGHALFVNAPISTGTDATTGTDPDPAPTPKSGPAPPGD